MWTQNKHVYLQKVSRATIRLLHQTRLTGAHKLTVNPQACVHNEDCLSGPPEQSSGTPRTSKHKPAHQASLQAQTITQTCLDARFTTQPHTPKLPLLYAYNGGRAGHQLDQVSTIVVRTMHKELLAALAVATRLAMPTWPGNSSKGGVATST